MKKIIAILFIGLAVFACKKEEKKSTPPINGSKAVYHGNGNTGGEVPIDGNIYKAGEEVTVLDNTGNLTLENASFIGWNANPSGTGETFTPGSKFNMGASGANLYAMWYEGDTYRVFYNGNGNTTGDVPIDNTSYMPGSQAIAKDNTGNLMKGNQVFGFWNTSAGGFGDSYAPSDPITIGSKDVELYAQYFTPQISEFVGFDIAGYCATKKDVEAMWVIKDDYHSFKANLIDVVWNGIEFVGFDIAGYCATKKDIDDMWVIQDDYHKFKANLVQVVWDGTQYVGFDIAGYCATKKDIDDMWVIQDDYHKFKANLVTVVWDGSQFVGFDIAGYCATKKDVDDMWVIQDDYHKFKANLIDVAWTGNEFVGFDIAGYCATKKDIDAMWVIKDDYHKFKANLVTTVYR